MKDTKIVGGQIAVAHSWPSIAYIRINYQRQFRVDSGQVVTNGINAACGGTLISKKIVLTAAQ